MKKILVFPTWALVRIMTPFLKEGHLFKNKKITLENWYKNSTDLTRAFSIFFWFQCFCIPYIIHILIK